MSLLCMPAMMSRQVRDVCMYLQLKQAVICIQSAHRGRTVRVVMAQRAAAATVVQRHWRGCAQRCMYLRMQAAAVRLQSAVRCRQLRSRFLIARSAAVTMQVPLQL